MEITSIDCHLYVAVDLSEGGVVRSCWLSIRHIFYCNGFTVSSIGILFIIIFRSATSCKDTVLAVELATIYDKR